METKDLILEKTFNLLLLKGFDNVSISDIQVATGLSRGLLYHYFKNKEELFIEVTEKYFVQIFDFDVRSTKEYTLSEFVDFMRSRFQEIEDSILSIAREMQNDTEVSILNYHFLFYQVMQRDIIFRNNYRKTVDKERIAWQYALKNSIKKNEIRRDLDVESASYQLFTLVDGIWFQAMFGSEKRHMIQSMEETLLNYIELLK